MGLVSLALVDVSGLSSLGLVAAMVGACSTSYKETYPMVRQMKDSIRFAIQAVVVFLGVFCASEMYGGLISVVNGIITNGTTQLQAVSGTAPNGKTWASYVTGTSPVAYFDLDTGTLMFDPKGVSMNIVDFRYGTTTISGSTPGPFVYTTGSGINSISTSSIERTWPAGTYAVPPTTFQARLGATVSLTNGNTLNTSGGNTASTDGTFNLPWSFGAVAPSLINSQATLYSDTAGQGFRSLTSGGNLLGYGNGIGMFAYTPYAAPFGPGAVQTFGVLVPVQAVPEPSTLLMAGLGVTALLARQARRRRDASAPATAA